MKTCCQCNKVYPNAVGFFHKDKQKKGGFRPDCKICRLNNKKYRYMKRKYAKKYYNTIIGHLNSVHYKMIQRCSNNKTHNYNRYGGRGIKCKFKTRLEFIDYVLKELFNVDLDNLQIDRIDNNGDYEPGNIRFVTAKENCNNRG